ncbi:MAG: hexitol phosphatase HxpB [Salinivirgaceae bacterium]
MTEAVIFDMDGLLIDSEPFWREAEISVFKKLGVLLNEDDCRGTTGMRVDEVVKFWSNVFPEANLPVNEVVDAIMREVTRLVETKGEPLPGVVSLLEKLKSNQVPVALASASSYALINAVLKKLKIADYFQVIQSAEHMEFGKPHPQVFLEAARRLKVAPEHCLVFEDSVYGVIAGKAAKMKVVAVPDQESFNKKGYCIADYKLNSLEQFNEALFASAGLSVK